jgi:hypothetical protein
MRLALFLVFAAVAFAQPVEVGVVGGVPITHDFTVYSLNPYGTQAGCIDCATQRTLPYVIGPAVQIHLWRFLFLDAQGLYSRADYIHTMTGIGFSGGVSYFFSDQYKMGVDRWEIPILIKLRLPSWHWVHPFVAAGVSLQHAAGKTLPGFNTSGGNRTSSAIGSTFALGTSFGSRWIRPSIEVRYTRWSDQPFPTGEITVKSKQDEAQILAGPMFGAGRAQPDSRGVLEGPPSERRVSLGLKGGLLLNDALSIPPSANRNTVYVFGTCYECGTERTVPYVAGPALEVRLSGKLAATAEAFYSRADYDHTFIQNELSAGFSNSEEKHIVDRWEAPLLLKYPFKIFGVTAFVTGGATIQYDRDSRVQAVYEGYCFTCIGRFQAGIYGVTLETHSALQEESLVAGPTAGVGASFRSGRVRPSIEARYTYWPDRATVISPTPQNTLPPPVGPPVIRSPHSEVQLLVGVMF